MLSTTPLFYFCTVLIFILFYSVRSPSLQTLVLAAGSFAMYATEGLPFLLLLTISSLLTSACSFIAANSKTKRAKIAMISGVIINLAVLAIFKYKELLVPMHIQPDITWVQKFLLFGLPIGISFYTFHGISLVVDAWRNPDVLRHKNNVLLHCLDTGLYLSFFPQLGLAR